MYEGPLIYSLSAKFCEADGPWKGYLHTSSLTIGSTYLFYFYILGFFINKCLQNVGSIAALYWPFDPFKFLNATKQIAMNGIRIVRKKPMNVLSYK